MSTNSRHGSSLSNWLRQHNCCRLQHGAGYTLTEFIEACLEMKVTPHVAQNTSGRRSAVPDAIARSEGYAISQQKRKLIEQGFGWAKTIGRMRQVMVRGLKRVDQMFVLSKAAYNLVRMRSLGKIRPQLQ
ncbi:hypothetical protein FHX61_005958 [Cupriavidus alkaliphilus]|uniref:Transposase DDE domain-containing protein n=1 Tax=Cupriavidus alkaliphilus TaxID=942866 RepID=A0A7W4VGQ5_9BURK|nr:hypothetical protein [Cupriavidus alkaliphilus]